jgi:hypothetical protein
VRVPQQRRNLTRSTASGEIPSVEAAGGKRGISASASPMPITLTPSAVGLAADRHGDVDPGHVVLAKPVADQLPLARIL